MVRTIILYYITCSACEFELQDTCISFRFNEVSVCLYVINVMHDAI